MALADLNVSLGLITKQFESGVKSAERSLRRFGRQAEFIGQDLTQSITVPLAGIGAAAVKSFADLERSSKALEAVTGSASETARQLERLRVVAQLPGLGFQEAVQASARLQAVGLSAAEAEAAISEFGNAVARSGGGRSEFDGAILALTQIASKGKISAEEINQLNERIFEIRPALESAFKTSDSEELQRLGITAEEFIARTTQELSKLERVQGGLSNAFENFGDSVRTSLATLGEEISRTLDIEGILNRLVAGLDNVVNVFRQLDEGTRRQIIQFAAAAAAIGPLILGFSKVVLVAQNVVRAYSGIITVGNAVVKSIFSTAAAAQTGSTGIGRMATAFRALTTAQKVYATTVVGLTIVAIGFIISKFIDLKSEVNDVTSAYNAVNQVQKQAAAQASSQIAVVDSLIDKISDETTSREDQIKAIQRLQSQYPDYFGNLNAENVSLNELKKSRDELNKSIIETARAQAAQSKLTQVQETLLELEEERAKQVERINSTLGEGDRGLFGPDEFDRALIRGTAGRALDDIDKKIRDLQGQSKRLAGFVRDAEPETPTTTPTITPITPVTPTTPTTPTTTTPIPLPVEPQIQALSLAGLDSEIAQELESQLDLTPFITPSQEALNQFTASLAQYQTGLEQAAVASEVLGGSRLEQLRQQISATEQIIREGLNAGLTQQDSTIASLIEKLGLLQGEYIKLSENQKRLSNAAQVFGNSLSSTINEGIKSVGDFAKAVGNAARSAISAFIAEGVAAAVKNALASAPFPLNIALAPVAGAAASALFNSLIPAFAEGGVVLGPTLGLVGEAGPEAIIPLNQIDSVLGGRGGSPYIAEARISGDDLLILLRDAEERQNRIG